MWQGLQDVVPWNRSNMQEKEKKEEGRKKEEKKEKGKKKQKNNENDKKEKQIYSEEDKHQKKQGKQQNEESQLKTMTEMKSIHKTDLCIYKKILYKWTDLTIALKTLTIKIINDNNKRYIWSVGY